MAESDPGHGKMLKTLKLSRRGKKTAITTRVKEIKNLVAQKGGRRRIRWLTDRLSQVLVDLREVCTNISNLSEEIDQYNDLEDVECTVDSCLALVSDYMTSRVDDPSSSGSFCSAWVKQHASGMLGKGSAASHSSDDMSLIMCDSIFWFTTPPTDIHPQ